MSRRTLRMAGVAALAVASAGVVAVAAVGLGGDGAPAASAATGLPPATTEVTRQTLVQHTDVDGVLGHGAATTVTARGSGTVTWLPAVGTVAERGAVLYRVDERPVVALYGALPAYRTLRAGDEGADVRQLEENLAALGRTGFTVDDEYTSATAAAVADWQDDLGLDDTGVVDAATVVYVAGPVRVSTHDTAVGAPAGGPVLRTTGTTRSVTVDLPVADQALAVAGAAVAVTLPSGQVVDGTIAAVGTVATAAESDAPGGGTESTIEVVVTIADQAALGTLDEAPVDVALRSAAREDVLTVPVAALLALAEGGYGLEIVEDTTSRVVAVEPGMFADGRVEVSGPGIAEGVTVGMPA